MIEQLKTEFPDRMIVAVDTLAASAGEGLIVYRALLEQAKGLSLNEVAAKVELEFIKETMLWFTVDDLKHLQRTGRLSNGAAWLGYVLKIKPVLHCDDQGKLVPVFKCTGRKSALKKLASLYSETSAEQKQKCKTVFISHSSALEDAVSVKEAILADNPDADVYLSDIGPVVGSHTGVGAIALFFTGDQR